MRTEKHREGSSHTLGRALGRLLVEMGMIVFSILLALSVNEWRDGRTNRELAATALRNIRTEITRNRASIAAALPGHRVLLEDVRQAEQDLRPGGHRVRVTVRLEPPTILHTAWDTAGTTGALTHMDYEQVLALAEVYSGQDWLKRLEDRLLGSINSDGADRRRLLRGFESSLRNYIDMEDSLEKAYDAMLPRLDGAERRAAGTSGLDLLEQREEAVVGERLPALRGNRSLRSGDQRNPVGGLHVGRLVDVHEVVGAEDGVVRHEGDLGTHALDALEPLLAHGAPAAGVLDALRREAGHEDEQGHRPPPWGSPPMWVSRHRPATAAAGAYRRG